MKQYKYGEQTFAIIDEELWVKVAVKEEPMPVVVEVMAARRGRPKKLKLKTGGWSRKKRLDEATQARIIQQYEDGVSLADLAQQNDVSKITIYRLVRHQGKILPQQKRRKSHEVPLKAIHGYRCFNCGHTFKSVLSKHDAYCPKPTCNKSTELEEIPAEDVV